jgi:hypothetical protein
LMSDQLWFSIIMRKTVLAADVEVGVGIGAEVSAR